MPARHCQLGGGAATRATAFTLLELLVVMATISMLLSLLLPSLSRLRQGAKAVKCMASLRVVAFDFQLFANDSFDEDRGDSTRLPGGVFHFEDFVERQYRVAEFWDGTPGVEQAMNPATDHMLCASVSGQLVRVPDTPCSSGAILPRANVGYSFNARLFQQTKVVLGRPTADLKTLVRSDILQHPNVPIAFDVDGEEAEYKGKAPYFTAPPLEDGRKDIYTPPYGDVLWFPSYRHAGKMNVVFVGGYVRSTASAVDEHGWDWKYQPDPLK